MTTRVDAGLEPTACGPTVEAVTVRRRFLNPIWLLASLPGYIGWRLLSAFPLGPVAICAGIGLLIACCVVIPWSVRHRMIRKPALEAVLAWVGVLSMGFFSSVFVFTVLRDFILLCAWGLLSAAHFGSLVATSAQGLGSRPRPYRGWLGGGAAPPTRDPGRHSNRKSAGSSARLLDCSNQ